MSSLPQNIPLYDPSHDSLYTYPPPPIPDKPWRQDPYYFTTVRISPIALSKMTIHARSGGSTEVMGLMTGYALPHEIIITDSFALPVEGTETRVNAQEDAYAYMVTYLESLRNAGRLENAVGWYHSHPGYGCWLSGIDVETEALQQSANEPFCAVVIDPEKTASSGKVEIGAFRTYPRPSPSMYTGPIDKSAQSQDNAEKEVKEDGRATGDGSDMGSSGSNNTDDSSSKKRSLHERASSIPLSKLHDYGAHADKYYPLTVTHYKSSLDSYILSQLHNRYWASTLCTPTSEANRTYAPKQLRDYTDKIGDFIAKNVHSEEPKLDGQYGLPPPNSKRTKGDDELERIVREGRRIGMEERAVVIGEEVKEKIFDSE